VPVSEMMDGVGLAALLPAVSAKDTLSCKIKPIDAICDQSIYLAYCGMTPNLYMLLEYTVDNGQRPLMKLTAAHDGS
jgi:hypothetical protein